MVTEEKSSPEIKSDLSKMVMEKIKAENKWAFPEHKQKKKPNLIKTRVLSSVVIIAFLVVIAMSFLIVPPYEEQTLNDYQHQQESVTMVNTTAFARSLSNIDFTEINEGMVASIAEPAKYNTSPYNWFQIAIILIILGSSMMILFVSWLSREEQAR